MVTASCKIVGVEMKSLRITRSDNYHHDPLDLSKTHS